MHDTVEVPDVISYEDNILDSLMEDVEKSAGAEEVVGGFDVKGLLSKLLDVETLLTEKLLSGNILAVYMAVIIATVLVYFLYKIISRQSRRDKAKDAKKKLKQQKNQKDSKKKV